MDNFRTERTTTFPGSFGGDHETADDVPFTGSHTITGFTILYHATVAVNATFKFYTVNASTGRLGSTVATFTTTNLAVGDHVFTMNLTPAQQFIWTATPNIYGFGDTATGGFFSVRFSAVGGGPLGASAGWVEASHTSFDSFIDVTDNLLLNFQGDTSASFYLQVLEAGAGPAPALSALRLVPLGMIGGNSAQGLISLTNLAPAGGTTVAVQTDPAAVIAAPATVTVPAGSSSATFTVTSTPVTQITSAFVTASLGGVTRSVNPTISPPVPTDTIAITQAQYSRRQRQLHVTATGSNSSALITIIETSSGSTIGLLTNVGGNSFVGNFSWPVNPGPITARSSFGGTASASVVQVR